MAQIPLPIRISRMSALYALSNINSLFRGILRPKKCEQIRWIFIVGIGHTGSSVLCKKLGELNEIFSCPVETEMFLGSSLRRILFKYILLGKAIKHQCSWIVEKTPIHREFIDHIERYFPNHILVVTDRSPIDTAVSQFNRKEKDVKVFYETLLDFVRFESELVHRNLTNRFYRSVPIELQDNFLSQFSNEFDLSHSSELEIKCKYQYNWVENWAVKLGYGYEVTEHEKLRAKQIKEKKFQPTVYEIPENTDKYVIDYLRESLSMLKSVNEDFKKSH